jgi:pyruvate/2-oxoglutarate dehydrogenase complex dihydrolipoamide dehydrogenase (E3) component
MMPKRIVVIGGGPAGVEAALAAAPHAQSVSIVSDAPIGDWTKLMPSRVWLTAVEQIRAVSGPHVLTSGHDRVADAFDMEAITAHVDRVAQSWSHHISQELKSQGVKLVSGRGSFGSPNRILVACAESDEELDADSVIIAAGSVPFFPPILQPDGQSVFSPETLFHIKTLPKSILVVGDGPPGFEFVDIFSQLGIRVIWIVLEGGPRSNFATEADAFLIDLFRQRGVEIQAGEPISHLKRLPDKVIAVRPEGAEFAAEAAFATLGYRANLAPIQLEAAGLETDEGDSSPPMNTAGPASPIFT